VKSRVYMIMSTRNHTAIKLKKNCGKNSRKAGVNCRCGEQEVHIAAHPVCSNSQTKLLLARTHFIRDSTISADSFRRLFKTYLFARYYSAFSA